MILSASRWYFVWSTSVYVKVISEELKFAHLPRSTLCEHWRWNNKSTYRCQL